MEIITVGRHKFEVVDSVPAHYIIWNIGKNMADGYLPMCEWANPGIDWTIRPDTLKAIRCPDAQVVLEAIGGGQNTVEKMEQYIRKHQKADPNTWQYKQVQRMLKAIPILKSIKIWGTVKAVNRNSEQE